MGPGGRLQVTDMAKILTGTLLILLLAAPSAAGDKIDNLLTVVGDCRTALKQLSWQDFRASKLAEQANLKMEAAEEAFGSTDDKQRRKGFKLLGTGLAKLENAVKREESLATRDFLDQWKTALWGAALGVYGTGDVVDPLTPEQEAILAKVGKKIGKAVNSVAKAKYGRAIKKLANAYRLFIRVFPDP